MQQHPPGSGHFGRTSPVARISRLKASAISGKLCPARDRVSRFAGYAGRAFGRGFAFQRFGVSRSPRRCRAGLRGQGERGAIFPALQPARLRLSERRDVWDLPPAVISERRVSRLSPPPGSRRRPSQDCAAGGRQILPFSEKFNLEFHQPGGRRRMSRHPAKRRRATQPIAPAAGLSLVPHCWCRSCAAACPAPDFP